MVSGCNVVSLGPKEPPKINYEWDQRLQETRWISKKDSITDVWRFSLSNQCDDIEYRYSQSTCSNTSYRQHLRDSLPNGLSVSISIRWYTSKDSILHTDAACSFMGKGYPTSPDRHVLRDWHYSFRNDTILVIDSVEYVKEVIDTAQ
jgi:hypothetical protein